MGLKLKGYAGSGTFAHGIHPPDHKKLSKDAPIRVMPAPDTVVLSLHQNIGGPCEPLVKPRQTVQWGETIGKGSSFVSTTLHASVPGIVQRPVRMTLANGRHMDTLPIKTEGEMPSGRELWDEIFGGNWSTTGLDAYAPAGISRDINDGGLTVMTCDEVRSGEETACVRCGKCVDVCPMNLVPTKIAMASRHQDIALSRRYNIMACFECGSCAYTCPAHIPLVQLIRAGKARLAAADRS